MRIAADLIVTPSGKKKNDDVISLSDFISNYYGKPKGLFQLNCVFVVFFTVHNFSSALVSASFLCVTFYLLLFVN